MVQEDPIETVMLIYLVYCYSATSTAFLGLYHIPKRVKFDMHIRTSEKFDILRGLTFGYKEMAL